MDNNILNKAKEHVYRKSKFDESDKIKIRGFDMSKPFKFEDLMNSYTSTGFQGTNVSTAVEIIKKMQEEKATIFFGCNSNMITSGIRDIIAYLMKEKKIGVFVTTGGGIEEDIIKCIGPFYLGSFNADNEKLRESGINRTGNIFVPNQRYLDFEKFVQPILKKLHERQKKENRIIAASELIWELGKEINDESSVLYWAWKNQIPAFCPSVTDGALGDQISFYKYNNPDFYIDQAEDIRKLDEISITSKKTGIIVLGSSAAKHHICNANQFRGGADYAVYITTETEEGGSDSGARVEEAISWGKVKSEAKHVKVYGDATIIFPLIAVGAFKN
jgi:deoxyhypusine synthase